MQQTPEPTLGYRIAQSRRQLGVRLGRDVLQSDVAAALDVGPATISRWEADQAVPRDAVLAKLAAFLGVTPAFLRYGIKDTVSVGGLEVEQVREIGKDELAALAEQARAHMEAATRAEQTTAPARRKKNGG